MCMYVRSRAVRSTACERNTPANIQGHQTLSLHSRKHSFCSCPPPATLFPLFVISFLPPTFNIYHWEGVCKLLRAPLSVIVTLLWKKYWRQPGGNEVQIPTTVLLRTDSSTLWTIPQTQITSICWGHGRTNMLFGLSIFFLCRVALLYLDALAPGPELSGDCWLFLKTKIEHMCQRAANQRKSTETCKPFCEQNRDIIPPTPTRQDSLSILSWYSWKIFSCGRLPILRR